MIRYKLRVTNGSLSIFREDQAEDEITRQEKRDKRWRKKDFC